MRLRSKLLAYIALALIVMSPVAAHAFGGGEHRNTTSRVMGFDGTGDWGKQEHFWQLVDEFGKVIDGQEAYLKLNASVKRLLPRFSWGAYGHRVFFHWGFETDLRRGILGSLIPAAVRDDPYQSDVLDRERQVWRMLNVERAKRNGDLKAAVMRAFMSDGKMAALRPEEVDSIAILIYDTHLVGDIIEGTFDPRQAVLPLYLIIPEIEKAGRNFRCEDKTLEQKFMRELSKLQQQSTFGIQVPFALGKKVDFTEGIWKAALGQALTGGDPTSIRKWLLKCGYTSADFGDDQIYATVLYAKMCEYIPQIIKATDGGRVARVIGIKKER